MNARIDQENVLATSIERLQEVNRSIAELTVEKEQLTAAIIGAFEHDKEGQRTYEYGIYKVTCKTPYIYSLDSKAYQAGDVYLPSEFDPIKEVTKFEVDKKLFDQYYTTAPASVRDSLSTLVTVKPGKPSVSIGVK